MPNFPGIQGFSVTLGTAGSPSMFLSCGQSVGTSKLGEATVEVGELTFGSCSRSP